MTSLIEFPCDFQIKIMGKNCSSFENDIKQLAYKHYPASGVRSIQSKLSSQGNYLAVRLVVYAQDQQTLDALYLDLTKHPDVKMVL